MQAATKRRHMIVTQNTMIMCLIVSITEMVFMQKSYHLLKKVYILM